MRVTSVHVYPLHRDPLMASADIVLDGGFVVTDLRIVRRQDGGLSVVYPVSQFASSNKNRYVCNPINRDIQQLIERAVLAEYRRTIPEEEKKK